MFDEVCRLQRRAVYESLVELLAAEGRAGEALTAAEKAKALMMADLLAGQDIGATPAERELLRQEAELGEMIRILRRRILHVSGEAHTGELLERLKGIEDDLPMICSAGSAQRAKSSSPLFPCAASIRSPSSVSSMRIPPFSITSRPNAACMYGPFTGNRFIWRRSISPREELRGLVFSFLAAIRDRDRRKTESLSRKAYDLLLKPVIPFVSGERIGFIPDDCLVYLPFAAMSYRGKFLAEGFSIFHLPEAGSARTGLGGKGTTGLRILAFGNPDLENETLDLHHAVEELERIRKRIGGTTVLLREQASEAKAEEMLAGYDILHFAVRGQFYPDETLNSGLLLTPGAGQDGSLTVREIFRLRFQGRAVVLSGCDPLPEKDPEGKGCSALQRAFLHAGSPSVVSTLWLVDDRAAAHLLDLFYRQLERKKSLADALRAAQLHLIREGYPPYVWAAFVLTGKY